MIFENDQTRDIARPVVVIAAIRSGGTFLTHCLSNHSQIFCDRGEPLHHMSVWCTTITTNRKKLLATLLNQTGYQVSMCRLTYGQALRPEIWKWLVKRQPRVIWLYRKNILRQAISVHLHRVSRRGQLKRPAHTFEKSDPVTIELEPTLFLRYARGLAKQNRQMEAALGKIDKVFRLQYDRMIGWEGLTAEKIPSNMAGALCSFLGVRYEHLFCDLRRVNPYPLREIIGNWAAVETIIMDSEFSEFLEE